MADYKYQDILIENGDVVLDAGRNPILIQDRAVIAQDIKHAIIESNLAVDLIAERSPSKKADIRTKLELLVEEDVRLVPGTVRLDEPTEGTIYVFADTMDFGELQLEIVNNGER
ncbi:DUF2590 domain-containing protein [Vibrio parahaemolyticus]|uniref:Tail tape measure protein n=1 Tax=Vibrio phage vB_ValM-yong1 TaxID=2660715 RepID=A0A6M3A3E8_9CAUD|nr:MULTISPECIES: DUF2590 family protein [Vibrio]YP_009885073.1 DUF2590 family protein [Vibrio phage Valm-yong1]ANB97594.1 hypothetical protein FORC14_1047 [Vibrio parahaemolyticus]ANQ22135.1 hypothetical protein BA893_10820 [Vibrio natriegens]EGR1562224.1 DUF2590 family protein [Vibrio alginolyticus]EGR2606641.1 DUF2590 family protein [Vibrio alginolyticus]EHH2490364.1 DUF2590 family protein [Vibrio parahaemolyticus]